MEVITNAWFEMSPQKNLHRLPGCYFCLYDENIVQVLHKVQDLYMGTKQSSLGYDTNTIPATGCCKNNGGKWDVKVNNSSIFYTDNL